MKIRKDKIVLKITNNTALPQSAEILGQIPLNDGTNNAVSLYTWNLSSENFIGLNNVSIQIANISNPSSFVTFSASLYSSDINSVVVALNTLNKGYFQTDGTLIYVNSNIYVYGEIYATSNLFISTWNTTNTSGGSSANNQIQLPLTITGNYDFVVDWGDGTNDTITSWNQPETLHTYTSSGTYTINISGILQGWSFNGSGDRNKILSVANWGIFRLTNTGNYFAGCSNLVLSSVADVLNLSGITSLAGAFATCGMLSTVSRINEWDTSQITNMSSMFDGSALFNEDISSWDVSNVTAMGSMFDGASSFNQNIGLWNVSNLITVGTMLSGATAFNQDISSWNIVNLIGAGGFMNGKTDADYSASYLDAIYNTWSTLIVQPNVTIDFGTIKYTASGSAGKAILQNVPNNWIITDGGI